MNLSTRFKADQMISGPPLPRSLGQLMQYRRPLLLQGPIGPFFNELAGFLERQGAAVRKINFNAGDQHFYGRFADDYTDRPEAWLEYFEGYVTEHEIDVVVLFGEWRFYHHEAHVAATRLGVPVFVFEEGYIRPHYVTLELQGVNGNSALPRLASAYTNQSVHAVPPKPFKARYLSIVLLCMTYYLVAFFKRSHFPHYRHHREFNPFAEGLRWIKGWLTKWMAMPRDTRKTQRLLHKHAGRYFFVPLQVRNDSQIARHSRYESVAQFIDEVVAAFAQHAGDTEMLVFKHHPMDRAYTNYRALIKRCAAHYGVSRRVLYVHESWMPALLDNAKGVIVVNSTVGLSGLLHKAPVIALGEAIYDLDGLSSQRTLAEFLKSPHTPDPVLLKQFVNKVVVDTQMNMSFYAPFTYEYALHDRVYTPTASAVDSENRAQERSA